MKSPINGKVCEIQKKLTRFLTLSQALIETWSEFLFYLGHLIYAPLMYDSDGNTAIAWHLKM